MRIIPAVLAASALLAAAPATSEAEPRCHEDQTCWTWSTMGNHTRGVITMYGRPLVVGVCRFQRLYRAGRLDYRGSQIMRGDRAALKARCS